MIFIKVRINVKWEQHKLENVFTKYQKRINPTQQNLELWSLTIDQGLVAKTKRYDRSFLVRKNDIFNLVPKGYFVYNPMNITLGTIDVNKYHSIAVSGYYIVLKSNDQFNVAFLASLLHTSSMINKYKRFSTGSLLEKQRLQFPNFAKVKIISPRLSEQTKIGLLMNQVNNLIDLQQRKLEQLKQLKKAMLQQLFVDKNNKQPNLRFKNFKGNWEQHRLEEVAQVTMGQSPSSKNYTDNLNDYVLVQGNADLKSNKISPRVWTKEVTKQVHKGEIIMTVRAPVGYLAMANMDAVIGRGVAAIDGNKYLYYLLQTKLMDRTWEKLSSGSTFESISSNDIKNLEIKVTETEEEKLIAKLMDTVTYFVTLQKNKLTQLTTLKKYLLQNLFI
ncbi:restriction endonuclease subunit S [Limosilactobacillus reuteri]|uniref:restriction endonuclease subunit S n=2 Tax=Limosilactobacillus reuteri TaxID=1598 RepID=UPI002D1FA538|nr:restriction endonuclease subunit S [Limosilactobacillus reuteri]